MSGPQPTEYYEGLEQRLRALVPLVEELMADLAGWYGEYVDVGEYGLAVEIVAERLSSNMPRDRVRSLAVALLSEAELMELPDTVVGPLRDLT
jgi:hypothetical protein